MFNNLVNGFDNVSNYIDGVYQQNSGIFSDIDFTILYNWLPQDIALTISAILVVLFILTIFQLLRKILFFL